MITIKHLLAMSILISTILTYGQTESPKAEDQYYIEVTGEAENEVIPDEIYISIVIREKYINKLKVTIDEQETKLKNSIVLLGIDLKNLSLSNANADYVRIHWKKNDVLTKMDYTLKVSDATQLTQVFQELEKLEITDAYISKVSHSKLDSLKKDVHIKAIKAAKEKADYLLTAIGETTGKPIIIRDNEKTPTSFSTNPYGLSGRGARSDVASVFVDGISTDAYKENYVIQFQKIKIKSSIYIRFSIK